MQECAVNNQHVENQIFESQNINWGKLLARIEFAKRDPMLFLLSSEEASFFLGWKVQSVRNAVCRGDLPCQNRRFRYQDLFLLSQGGKKR